MKRIELPRKVVIGDGAIDDVIDVTSDLGLTGPSVVLADHTTKEIAGEKVELKTGDICSIAPNVEHSTTVLGDEKVESISIFTPGTEPVIIRK